MVHERDEAGSAEEGVDLVFDNPELSPGSVLPQLTVAW
jgi:hypothetical protein